MSSLRWPTSLQPRFRGQPSASRWFISSCSSRTVRRHHDMNRNRTQSSRSESLRYCYRQRWIVISVMHYRPCRCRHLCRGFTATITLEKSYITRRRCWKHLLHRCPRRNHEPLFRVADFAARSTTLSPSSIRRWVTACTALSWKIMNHRYWRLHWHHSSKQLPTAGPRRLNAASSTSSWCRINHFLIVGISPKYLTKLCLSPWLLAIANPWMNLGGIKQRCACRRCYLCPRRHQQTSIAIV